MSRLEKYLIGLERDSRIANLARALEAAGMAEAVVQASVKRAHEVLYGPIPRPVGYVLPSVDWAHVFGGHQ